MSNLDALLETLNPKIAKSFKRARDVENVRLPMASARLTQQLNGGIGKGRMSLFYGNTSAGKSALIMQSIGLWQAMGEVCVYVDTEGTWDNDWAESLGVDVDELILIQSKSGAKIYEQVKPLLEAEVGVLVIDSISMILSDEFIDGDGNAKGLVDQRQIGAHAKAITKLISALHYSSDSTAILVISQTTTEIGQTYTKQIPHGGKKMLFASSQIVKLTSSSTEAKLLKKEITVGNRVISVPVGRAVDFLVEKNKLGPQGGTGSYDFYFKGDEVGVDRIGEIIDMAIDYGVIKKGGSWLSIDELSWQGRSKAVDHYRALPDDLDDLKTRVLEVENGSV